MITVFIEKITEIRNNIEELERKLEGEISLYGKKVSFKGDALQEYEAGIILDAIAFGFSAHKALLLKDADNTFRKIPIKNFTRRKDLEEVRARIIGTEGKTRRTLEQVGDCEIIISEKEVGIIGSAESMERATTAITNLIKGSKQANVYRYLERVNALKRERKEVGTFKNKKRVKEEKEDKRFMDEEDDNETDD